MTDNVNNNSEYDPDNPPPREPFAFYGRLVNSQKVDNVDEADAAGIGENYRKYMEASKKPLDTPVWLLTATAVDGLREDGSELTQTEMIPLKSAKGTWLGPGNAPDILATAFRTVTTERLTASHTAVGTERSAVGKIFHFTETEVKLGKQGKFTKNISLYPDLYVEDGVTIVQRDNPYPNKKTEGEGRPEVPADASPEETQAVAKALAGGTRADVFNRLMSEPALKGISRVLGHDLIQAATDDSLPDLLIQAGFLADEGGVLQLVKVGAAA